MDLTEAWARGPGQVGSMEAWARGQGTTTYQVRKLFFLKTVW